jgi:hypothetical protein
MAVFGAVTARLQRDHAHNEVMIFILISPYLFLLGLIVILFSASPAEAAHSPLLSPPAIVRNHGSGHQTMSRPAKENVKDLLTG